MLHRHRKLFLFLLLALVLAALPLVVSAGNAWANYHWARSSNPVALDVGDNVSGTWDGHLDVAISDWNESAVLNLTEVTGRAKGRCRATDGRIEVCNDTYGFTGWLGVAQIWVTGDHIDKATTKVNDSYFNSPPYNEPEWRQMVMCQEIGHDFGLAHQDEDFDNPNLGSCMDYTSDPSTNQHPNDHDYQQLADMYAHLDELSGGDDGGGDVNCPPKSNKPECRNGSNNGLAGSDLFERREWGRLVRSQGRTAVYERDFGLGRRVITFVIWAD